MHTISTIRQRIGAAMAAVAVSTLFLATAILPATNAVTLSGGIA
ncbi:MAG: hypothetical protein WA948_08870 [Pontixanthobacter sp.]